MSRSLAMLAAGLLASLAMLPAGADAHRYDVRVGIGDQNIAMFSHPAFQRMKVRQVRYFIPWNAIHHADQRLAARRWVKEARRHGQRPFLHISTDDLREGHGTLPSARRYAKDVGRLVAYFRKLGVRDFGAWNEANHKSQPTARHPERVARYFRSMRNSVFQRCGRSCRVVGLDVLDQAGVERYVRDFMRALPRGYASRYLRVVGIHNYSDVNRQRTSGLRKIIRAVHRHTRRPNFWLTETGGVVKFARAFPCSESRAADRLDYLFDTVRSYRRHIQRVYLYNWTAAGCDARFDAGLTDTDGSVREGYGVVRRHLRHFKR